MRNNINVNDTWEQEIQSTTSLTLSEAILKINKKEMTANLTPARMVELLKEIVKKYLHEK